jgi:hypothetical protein
VSGLKYPEKKRHGAMHTSFCLIKLIAPALLGRRCTYLSSSIMFYNNTHLYVSRTDLHGLKAAQPVTTQFPGVLAQKA